MPRLLQQQRSLPFPVGFCEIFASPPTAAFPPSPLPLARARRNVRARTLFRHASTSSVYGTDENVINLSGHGEREHEPVLPASGRLYAGRHRGRGKTDRPVALLSVREHP